MILLCTLLIIQTVEFTSKIKTALQQYLSRIVTQILPNATHNEHQCDKIHYLTLIFFISHYTTGFLSHDGFRGYVFQWLLPLAFLVYYYLCRFLLCCSNSFIFMHFISFSYNCKMLGTNTPFLIELHFPCKFNNSIEAKYLQMPCGLTFFYTFPIRLYLWNY